MNYENWRTINAPATKRIKRANTAAYNLEVLQSESVIRFLEDNVNANQPDRQSLLALDLQHASFPVQANPRIEDDNRGRSNGAFQNREDHHENDFFQDFMRPEGETFEPYDWLQHLLAPPLPLLKERHVDLVLSNPYANGLKSRHPTVKKMVILPENGGVNGYVKFRLRMADLNGEGASTNVPKGKFSSSVGGKVRQDAPPPAVTALREHIPTLPLDFGRDLKLDATDNKLFKFYIVAFCKGRTLLSKTNVWLTDIAPMATSRECVQHALLALAGAYVLDYLPSAELLRRTNDHYEKAVVCITQALRRPENHEVGQGDDLISAILLLLGDDCVNWELRRSKNSAPNWYRGGRLAKALLDHSDPGYRYWKSLNVQWSSARLGNANWGALACILGDLVTPLVLEDESDPLFGWLLQGSQRDVLKLHGCTGLCPKLLHMFAQITHLTARIAQTPDSIVIPFGASKIEERLGNLRQWSELSEGHSTTAQLFESCITDEEGKVGTAAKVTELTGEAWLATAKIYLHCRFFRKPRSHPKVLECLDVLTRCIEYMPCSGPLFTSQAPLCPVFIMGLVSTQERHRKVAREWFGAVLFDSDCRSSVPPVWEALQLMWDWMDTELVDDTLDEACSIGARRAWWEEVVAHLMEKVGWVSLT